MKNRPLWGLVFACALMASSAAEARIASKTVHPIVFAHGMAGFDDILGYDYWGDDYGYYVLDPYANWDIDWYQRSFVASVTPFQSSEQRGYQLYQDILGYMASSGATSVNIIGHSQGGLDLRKAAKSLYTNKGRQVVKYGISISSPHRGSPIAKHVWRLGAGVQSVIEALAEFYGNIVYGAGNNAMAGLKQLIHDDVDPNDGVTTGTRAFNASNPASTTYIARPRSILTAQQGSSMNPALYIVNEAFYDPDGDGCGSTDSDGDGALGGPDGSTRDTDDDGLVGLNSQQMGYRLQYYESWGELDWIFERTDTGYVGDLNAPSCTAMSSHNWVVNQDHLDVIGVPPDTFDEMEFYAAITDYIADGGY